MTRLNMSYTELTVWTRGIIMDKEGRDIVNSVAASARLEGKHSQAMENYVDNPDRTNCPTRKYLSLIHIYCASRRRVLRTSATPLRDWRRPTCCASASEQATC